MARILELPTPPMSPKQLHEFAFTVNRLSVCTRVCEEMLFQPGCEWSMSYEPVFVCRTERRDLQVSDTRRMAPEETTTMRDLEATSFSRRRCVR